MDKDDYERQELLLCLQGDDPVAHAEEVAKQLIAARGLTRRTGDGTFIYNPTIERELQQLHHRLLSKAEMLSVKLLGPRASLEQAEQERFDQLLGHLHSKMVSIGEAKLSQALRTYNGENLQASEITFVKEGYVNPSSLKRD